MSPPPDDVSVALERLLARYAGLVRSAARSHRADEATVDEILQEVRIRLWRAIERGEKADALPASYVYRAAVSATLDLIRGRRRKREVPLEESRLEEPRLEEPRLDDAGAIPASLGTDRTVDEEAAMELLDQALAGMVATRRVAVRLHLAGYHLREIAAMMDSSEARARNLVYRGLADLRTRLTSMGLNPRGRG